MKKTEQKIIDAFINIAATRTTENMEYSKITVSEIIEAAQVSKPTFYRHYKNIYFLIDAIKIIKFSPMIEILNAYQYKNDAPPFSIIATQIIPFFFDNQIFFRIMRNSSFDFNYQQYLEKQFYPFFHVYLNKSQYHYGFDIDFLADYYSKVTIALLTNWIDDAIPDDIDVFQEKFLFIINSPVNIFL